jgi:hypothetical protein
MTPSILDELNYIDELNLTTQWSGNVKKVIEVVNQIVVETIMHGKGIELEGDWPHIVKQKFYDDNYHQLDKNSYIKNGQMKNTHVVVSIKPMPSFNALFC